MSRAHVEKEASRERRRTQTGGMGELSAGVYVCVSAYLPVCMLHTRTRAKATRTEFRRRAEIFPKRFSPDRIFQAD